MTAVAYPSAGTIFGSWTVLSPAQTGKRGREVLCRCTCGNEAVVVARQLRRGKSTKCLHCAHVDLQKHPQVGLLTSLLWNQILTGARVRGILVAITQSDAWQVYQAQQGRCALSGIPLCSARVASKRTETTASLDRVDPNLGYVLGNIQWVHKEINRMKGDLTDAGFIELCQEVSRHRSPQ